MIPKTFTGIIVPFESPLRMALEGHLHYKTMSDEETLTPEERLRKIIRECDEIADDIDVERFGIAPYQGIARAMVFLRQAEREIESRK